VNTRLRPSYFPFVEPGAEMDMQCVSCNAKGCRICSQTGWLEIGGCGMIHPNVFEAVGYDSEEYTGFAFGFGIDRMAMLKYGLPDLRQLFDGSKSFLNQFSTHL
jgi:phenylalanyl-tRNA synthetase alpha chain